MEMEWCRRRVCGPGGIGSVCVCVCRRTGTGRESEADGNGYDLSEQKWVKELAGHDFDEIKNNI